MADDKAGLGRYRANLPSARARILGWLAGRLGAAAAEQTVLARWSGCR